MTDTHAPFPYFGGKRKAAPDVWARFGDVPNYVEPFCGSMAVLLARPHAPRVETVNDANGYLVNFWRSVQSDPDAVAHWADWPVSELDLHARHRYLVVGEGAEEFREDMRADPDYCDHKRAGWWVWGQCAWIGGGWCEFWEKEQLPHLGDPGMGVLDWFRLLSDRLRRVRICCGDWTRVLGPTPTTRQGITGVFLDPPYVGGEWDADCYTHNDGTVSAQVRKWALEHGSDPLFRIALCGFDTEHTMPGWYAHAWHARGGYGNKTGTNANRKREVIWFSPHCISQGLFGDE